MTPLPFPIGPRRHTICDSHRRAAGYKRAFFILAGAASVLGAAQAASPRFEAFAVSDLVRVFEDGAAPPASAAPAVSLFGVRNEVVSGQCVVRAGEDLTGLSVSVAPLAQEGGAGLIPAEDVSWNFVGGIYIRENSPNARKADVIRAAPAWFPDYLAEERQFAVTNGTQKAVYLTIKIPPEVPPGEYRGSVKFTADGSTVSVPLNLQVYPLVLPEQRHLMVTEWFSTSQFRKHHHIEPGDEEAFFRMLGLYARNMAEHRQNTFRLGLDLVQSSRTPDGKLSFDFSRFDRWADVFWDTGHMDLLETGFVARFGEGGWSSPEIFLQDFSVKEQTSGRRVRVKGEEFLPEFLPALLAHLRAKGWLEKTVFHICDEPSDHNVMDWRNASAAVHRWAPELRRIDAIETPHCLGELEVWVPKLDHLATWRDLFERAQRQGNDLWFYTVGIFQGGSFPNKTVDVPLIESRLLHWLNYRYQLTGYLHWGYNAWTDDPFRAPGQHRGDGWHVYPKADGLLDSLRWEQMRNGLEDYECLWLLEDALAKIKAAVAPRVASLIEPKRRGIEIASRVVASYGEFTRDPEVLYRAKRQAIEEALALAQSPRVVLQTNPLEGTPVARNCAVDVHGWAEPGTVLRINRQRVTVAPDGLFLQECTPSAQGEIVVEAENGGGKKTLTRQFTSQIPRP